MPFLIDCIGGEVSVKETSAEVEFADLCSVRFGRTNRSNRSEIGLSLRMILSGFRMSERLIEPVLPRIRGCRLEEMSPYPVTRPAG
jgi:hypothetical protein